ncbi:methionine--tRNA ligase [Chloroflexota bacterium]
MSEKIFIGVAWPYANGSLHLGQVAGAYLPADIFARYHRLKGDEVLMVSGADQHGTPITIKAEQEGKTAAEIGAYYLKEFRESWQKLGISFDLFTSTGTENHARTARDIFLTLLENGYAYKDTVSQPYCPKCNRFLPDRYVEGTCPFCRAAGARGDQCDACGKPMNSNELADPQCRICGTAPEFKDSEHVFFKLSAFGDQLLKWVEKQSQWRPNVKNLTLRYLKEGLRDRAITRDINWGVPVPLEGFENKRLYVWFEAVIGYLSAAKEWAEANGDAGKWRDFWEEGKGAKSYYFIGKDNIPFHTLIWPAMLLGYNKGLNLPHDIPANEFLTIEGRKLSTSKNWAIWLPDYLSRYDPDPLRYAISINMPETGDTDFSWRELIRRNNDELVATYGNLVNRVLTFVYKNFDGCVPTYAAMGASNNVITMDARDIYLDTKSIDALEQMDISLSRCSFKQALKTGMSLAQEANRYLDEKSPWKVIKEDRQAAAISLYMAIRVISRLKTALYPFLPFSSQKVHEYLGFEGSLEEHARNKSLEALPEPGQPLNKPQPLFTKLEDSLVEEETSKIGQPPA